MWKWFTRIGVTGSVIAAWLGLFISVGGSEFIWPFEPRANVGRPILQAVEQKGKKRLTIALPIALANKGSATGCVVDVALKVRDRATGQEWAFFPAKFLEPTMYDYRVTAGVPQIAGPPTVVRLEGGQTLIKAVWFFPRPAEGKDVDPMALDELRAGRTYDLTVYVMAARATCELAKDARYAVAAGDSIDLKTEMLQGLKEGKPVEMPGAMLDSARERLLKELVSP